MVFAPSHVQLFCYFCVNSPKCWCSSSSRSLCLLFAFCQQPLIQSASHLVGIMQYKKYEADMRAPPNLAKSCSALLVMMSPRGLHLWVIFSYYHLSR